MALIELSEANAWTDKNKLDIAAFDDALLEQVEAQVLSALTNSGYDTSTWADAATTPDLVRAVISMLYVAWLYDRTYSEDVGSQNNYANLLRRNAQANITGIIDGTFPLADGTLLGDAPGSPSFYPNDLSSAADITWSDDTSVGPEKFSMGMTF